MSTGISDLPYDIMALIFKGVPLPTIGECRAVCKEWYSLIMSHEFSPSTFEKPIHQKPMLVENDHLQGCCIRMYSTSSDSWESMSLPFLADAPQRKPLYLTASSGGLLCFETNDRKSFIICNPITQKCRHLRFPVVEDEHGSRKSARRGCSCLNPTFCIHGPENMPDILTGLVVDREGDSYMLIVAFLEERKTFIYNSLQHSWTTGAQVPEGKGFVSPIALSVKGNLYCIIVQSDGKIVAKYDARHDIWYCSVPLASRNLPSFFGKNELELLEHRGGVKLLARRTKRGSEYLPFYRVGLTEYRGVADVAVFSVFETSGGIEIGASQWRDRERDWHARDWSDLTVKQRLENPYASYYPRTSIYPSTKWQALASAYSASSAGHNDLIYSLGNIQALGMIHVVKLDCSNCSSREEVTLLPSLGTGTQTNIQVELRLFEPSLTGQV